MVYIVNKRCLFRACPDSYTHVPICPCLARALVEKPPATGMHDAPMAAAEQLRSKQLRSSETLTTQWLSLMVLLCSERAKSPNKTATKSNHFHLQPPPSPQAARAPAGEARCSLRTGTLHGHPGSGAFTIH
ncbi:hypothetical protein PoB_004759100 [Plakobranchus ocellatus]|uniref:Uncharacterized protein n=1 Tax=Plakobranchus ocellatus TaxID=259542 RepID=A0AAV4BCL1_9GAST|nr:hypothetical protein PoB_004759100 [Plakobranchus ocellatus]